MEFHIEDDHYGVKTPRNANVLLGEAFYQVAAEVTCKKCDKKFMQVLRYARYRNGVLTKQNNPRDEIVSIEIVRKAHKNHDTRCTGFFMDRPATILAGIERVH